MGNLGLGLGGVGAFLLARDHDLSRPAASVTGFIFILNGSFLRWSLELWQYGVCIAWVPWLILLMKKASRPAHGEPASSRASPWPPSPCRTTRGGRIGRGPWRAGG